MKLSAAIAGALLLPLALGACGAPASGTSSVPESGPAPSSFSTTSPPAVETETPTSAATTAHPPSGDFAGVAHIKDKDGYTFDVGYQYSANSIIPSVTDEKPGLNSLVIKLHSVVSIENTTPGRKLSFKSVSGIVAPLSDPHFYVIALWNGTSPVCNVGSRTPAPDTKCGIQLSFGRITNDIAASAKQDLTVYAGLDNGGGTAGIAHVPDAQLASVREALAKPDDFVIAYSAGDNNRFVGTCPNPDLDAAIKDSWSPGSAASMYNNGYMPVFSRSGTCQSFFIGPQPSGI